MKYMKLGSKADAFQSDGSNVRFVATELATDIIVYVDDVKFYLHKFPLLSRSPRLQRLVLAASEESNVEIHLPDIPGGPAAFEICAKFCYGMITTLNAYNVVAARCAAEYLEMHETVEKGNLIYKIDVFLNSSIFRSWKDSIIVLQSTKSLQSCLEDLKVVNHCIESIAFKASIDPVEVEWSYTYNRKKPIETSLDMQWNGVMKQKIVPKDWWAEDLCEVELDSYKRVIAAIKSKGRVASEVIGEALKAYVYRRLPGFNKISLSNAEDFSKHHRTLVETIAWLLPSNGGSVSCNFLLKLLKAASYLNCSEVCKKELIKKAGHQLEEASIADLMIPAPVEGSTLYDIDLFLKVLEEFFMREQNFVSNDEALGDLQEDKSPHSSRNSMACVAKLIDGYLTEAAKDSNLTLSKFVQIVEMSSSCMRPVHDGLYHAIDMFLKEHPNLTKIEKKALCHLMDCKKLSPDASMHAVQNDRLPLRVVVQILFFEQVRQYSLFQQGALLPHGDLQSLAPRENNDVSHSSSRSTTTMTNTRDEWDGISKNANGDRKDDDGKVKTALIPSRKFSKLWSGKVHGGENSSSDTSDGPGSVNPDDAKSTASKQKRHSLN